MLPYDLGMSKTEKHTYKIAGPATWELIRAAYLAGESAPALAARYGVSAHAIRKRITKERWTKRDFAAALEARGMASPFALQAPDYVEESVVREQARLAALEAAEAEEHAWVERVAAEESPSDIADALERRALAQAGAALVRGRASESRALAALAEQMRKRGDARVSAPARTQFVTTEPSRELSEEDRTDFVSEMFAKIAYIAGAMVHAPETAPGAFRDLIAQWRAANLGEGEADARAAAARVAEAQSHFLSGDWTATLPEEVRAHLRERWAREMARDAASAADDLDWGDET